MIDVLEPQDPLLRQFVDSIYLFRKGGEGLEFTAYPSMNTPVALLRDARVTVSDGVVCVQGGAGAGYVAMACNQFFSSVRMQYAPLADEIAINFKPLGFASFTRGVPPREKLSFFNDWDNALPDLFDQVFGTDDRVAQLAFIEVLLLAQYQRLAGEPFLLRALALLDDISCDHKMQEVARLAGVHYKQLYRSFTGYVGCSPVHYRKLVKFRSSVIAGSKEGDKQRLVDICYDHDYPDQPYFIRQFKELTGEQPSRFFKDVTSFGDKVVFRVD